MELNNILSILATIFPRILPEVFRELLLALDGESRLHVAVEQLLNHQDYWVRGRWRTSVANSQPDTNSLLDSQQLITTADEFRRPSYKSAVRKALYHEFKVLSKSKIEAVLAEENFCYNRARPVLQKLAKRSWKNTLNVLIAKWRKPPVVVSEDHYMLVWLTTQSRKREAVPIIRNSGDAELDLELHQRVLKPLLDRIKSEREANDWEAAIAINEAEAKCTGAIYECKCCYSETTFEQMAYCTGGGHVNCFRCIWHAVSEALFGQSWRRNIEHARGEVRCLASISTESCEGCIPQDIAKRAISQFRGGEEALTKLELRLAEEAVSRSGLSLFRCPFCTYVEADELYCPPNTIRYRLNTAHLSSTILLLAVMFICIPFIFLYGVLSHIPLPWALPYVVDMFLRSLAHLSRARHLPRRFQCLSPSCGLLSCMTCLKSWQDPHVCHESAMVSLRTVVEAARTDALKRTCPHCGLGFIKDSGCNKLTCVCGYSMCYICRQGLGHEDGGEGYRHFCQHFRAAGGLCEECDKCDLYKNEDDEILIRRAGTLAEKRWKGREGMMGVEGPQDDQRDAALMLGWAKARTVQGFLNWWVEQVLTC